MERLNPKSPGLAHPVIGDHMGLVSSRSAIWRDADAGVALLVLLIATTLNETAVLRSSDRALLSKHTLCMTKHVVEFAMSVTRVVETTSTAQKSLEDAIVQGHQPGESNAPKN